MSLADEAIRQQFINNHGVNFSVIAPAGVGKTTAIALRIAQIVKTKSIPLDRLVVVTYTEKAAKELKERTLQELQNIAANDVEQIFFGTIHALADRLLRLHGNVLHIEPDFTVEQNPTALWEQFLEQYQKSVQIDVPWNSFISFEMICNLVKRYPNALFTWTESLQFPKFINWDTLLNFKAPKNKNIQKFQKNLQRWIDEPDLNFPELQTTAKEFVALYKDLMRPIYDACSQYLSNQCHQLAKNFLQFRIQQQRLFFDDLIEQALQLVQMTPELKNYYVILDEAQDTDPNQFQFLENLASPQKNLFPLPGHFCMVGDPQQSIYNERADVHFYTQFHEKITKHGQALSFSVTMRFSQKIVDYVAQLFAPIFDGKNNQVSFSPIQESLNQNLFSDWYKIDAIDGDCKTLATLFSKQMPGHFGVKKWSDIAILCPRKIWLEEIKNELAQHSIACQMHSTSKRYGEFREFAWIHALITYALDTNNKFELLGILREIFAYSDHALTLQQKEIQDSICELNNLAEKIRQQSPLCALHTLEEFIKERILSVQNSYNVLKTIERQAAMSSSLIDFKMQLDQISDNLYETDHIDDNALQLYTFHKAKGLEWPMIIIPFINREPYPSPKSYPDISNHRVIFSKSQQIETEEEINSYERLLYVALTRQKQNTLFIDDNTIPKPHSLKNILDRGNFSNLKKFDYFKNETDITLPIQPKETFTASNPDLKIYPVIRPSKSNISLVNAQPRCADPQKYGNWWHAMIANCPFKTDYKNYLISKIKESPDPVLAQNDIELLIENDQIWEKFATAQKIFTEFPFSIQQGETVTEGRIDVVLFYDLKNSEIIDWKTENTSPETAIEHYAPQLFTYKSALQQSFAKNIKTSIYLTVSGELISI